MVAKTNTPTLILFAMILFLVPLAFAQPQQNNQQTKKDKIEQLRIAFITKELDLTAEEAEKFWPVYNEMEKKKRNERKSRNEGAKQLRKNHESMSEADIEKKTKELLDMDIKIAEIKKETTEKVAGVIGYKKALKLLEAEKKFKNELLRRVNQPHQPQPNGNGNQNRPRPQGQNRQNQQNP